MASNRTGRDITSATEMQQHPVTKMSAVAMGVYALSVPPSISKSSFHVITAGCFGIPQAALLDAERIVSDCGADYGHKTKLVIFSHWDAPRESSSIHETGIFCAGLAMKLT